MADSSSAIGNDLQLVLWFGIIAVFISYLAWKNGYYKRPLPPNADDPKPSFLSLLFGFGGFLIIFFLVSPYLAKGIKQLIGESDLVAYFAWVNFSTQISIILYLFIVYGISYRILKTIFKNSNSKISTDILIGMLTWVIAFPIVVAWTELINSLLYLFFNVKEVPEQLAIQYLKLTLKRPGYFLIALTSISILAPFMEEFLFRGLLQNYLKQHIGTLLSIVSTSILFSLFHSSFTQGLGNISIVSALFILSCFLGFIYERQRSLFASIALHATFNCISIFNLIFLKSDI